MEILPMNGGGGQHLFSGSFVSMTKYDKAMGCLILILIRQVGPSKKMFLRIYTGSKEWTWSKTKFWEGHWPVDKSWLKSSCNKVQAKVLNEKYETGYHCLSLIGLELLCRPGWHWVHRDLSVSAFPVLRLKLWAITFYLGEIFTWF